jgi:hypothetical protein
MQPNSTALEQISQAAQTPDRWLPAAEAAASVLREEAWRGTHPSAGDWINDAAHRAGYSANAFRRQVRVADFLRERVEPAEWQSLLQRNIPFGNLEVLQRLFDTNPEQATSLLPQVIKGEVTYRAMRELYQKAQDAAGGGSGKKLFANRVQRFTQRAVEKIQKHQNDFLGATDPDITVDFHSPIRGFPYARPDLLVFGYSKAPFQQSAPAFVDAFEMKLFGMDDSRQVLVRTLEQASLLETFFRQIWLVYPSSTPPVESHEQHVKELCFHLIALGMKSVGVALIPEESNPTDPHADAPELRHLPTPNPRPDRAELLKAHLQRSP